MAAHFGHRVKQLMRVRIGTVKLGHSKVGQWRNLTQSELQALCRNRTEW
jgi:23S rRNA pseudouridine2604 synthase